MHEKSLVIGERPLRSYMSVTKKQMVIPINLSLLKLTSKVPEPNFFPFTEDILCNSYSILYSILYKNVQLFTLSRQPITLPTAKGYKGKVRSEGTK